MIDSNSQFFAILTAVGEAKQANATALGLPWTFTEMAVGDANGTDPIPLRSQTRLINEWRRAPVNQVRTDPANPNVVVTEQVIPADAGGRWIREIALYDADGDMVAVANCAPSFKPLLAQGTGKTQVIRMNFIVSNTAQIVLKIDPAVVLATRDYVDNAVIEALAKLDFKHSALVATTANIALSGLLTVDGVLLPADARVLVKNQTQAKDNGLYVASAGAWKRATDADSSLEVTPGLFVSIEKGTVNGDSVWQLVTDGPIVLGTTALAFEMAVGRTGISAGSYANVTVDKYGRVIAGTNPTTLAGHGITDTYTKAEIQVLVAQASSLPVGSMVAFPKGTVPAGFFEADGRPLSIAEYPDLAAYLGTTFNKGDEVAGDFRLPDSRGEFLRGWDHGRGVDPGRTLGSWQKGSLQAFDPTVSATYTGGLGHTAPDTGLLEEFGLDPLVAANYPRSSVWHASASTTSTIADAAGQARPRNLAVVWCIKAWNAPINQGNIDVAALAAVTVQATETNRGTAKVASDVQMLDGANDLVMLTPKKARKGFAISLAENGYIAFPTWLGGVIFQWGVIPVVAVDTVVPLSFTLAFPGSCLGGVVVGNRATAVSGGTSSWYFASPTKTGATLVHDGSNGGTMGAYWFSWGN
jgi:phage-related tail fiber protein